MVFVADHPSRRWLRYQFDDLKTNLLSVIACVRTTPR